MRKLLVIAGLSLALGGCEQAADPAEAPAAESPAAEASAAQDQADTVDAADAAVEAMIEDAEGRADATEMPAAEPANEPAPAP